MLHPFLKYKINIKILISFIFIIIITTNISLLISYWLFKASIEKSITIRLRDSSTVYYNEIKLSEETCLDAASILSKDSTIVDLVSLGDRASLEDIMRNYYRMAVFDIVEIVDIDGSVLIRLHDLEEKGDFKTEQNIIIEGLAGNTVVSYESGKSGIAIRAVAPLKKNGNIIGLLMIGKLFSEKLVEDIKKLTGLDNGIYWKDIKIISTYDGVETIDNNIMEELLENGSVMFEKVISKDKYYVMLKAIYTDDEHYWGAIALFSKEESNTRYLPYVKRTLYFMLMIGFFLSFLAYIILANDINSSLSKIINGINNFNIESNLQVIDIEANDEFKIIAESINNFSEKIFKYNQQIIQMQDDMIKSAKLAVVGQLSAGLAHEIKNPLSSIKMMSQIIKSRYLKGGDGSDEINTVLEEIDRIDKLIKDLLEFSKPKPMNFSYYDINELVLDTVNIYKYNFEKQNITVEYKLADNLPALFIDSEKIRICFINFIVNAIEVMSEDGKLIVSTVLQNDKVAIEFKNNGPAIAKEDIDNIFEPFFTTKRQGTGLGLALSKLIIERHQGTIGVASNDKETSFIVTLPLKNNNI
ncbi:MAG: ATP-binding protein [Spirochaetaceae bacterium]|nr:ATP-binding protein [Spirochaetaceae bacterium]